MPFAVAARLWLSIPFSRATKSSGNHIAGSIFLGGTPRAEPEPDVVAMPVVGLAVLPAGADALGHACLGLEEIARQIGGFAARAA